MLKKTFTIMLSALCCTALLTACGGNSSSESSEESTGMEPIEVKLESTSINGKLGKAFDVVEKTYKITEGDYGPEISVTIKRNDSKPKVNFDDLVNRYSAFNSSKPLIGDFKVEFLDESGNKIDDADLSGDSFDSLISMVEGDETSITFTCTGDDLSEAKSFRVISIVKDNDNAKDKKGKTSTGDDDLDEAINTAKESAEAAGKVLDAASSAIDALNSLTK